jgi:chromosomal replication initiator protein
VNYAVALRAPESSSLNLWQSLLPALKERVNEQNFEIWLSSVRFFRSDEQKLSLQVPNAFFQEYLREHYSPVIEEELFRRTQRRYQVEFVVPPRAEAPAPAKEAAEPETSSITSPAPSPEASAQESGLIPGYRFNTFVVGPSNQFAHAACQAVADRPGNTYNPLFLFGGVGLGKTHLLHSIGARILEKNPKFKIRYLSSEDFVNEVINAIRYERVESFHKKYREECDVLLVDDIQFIAGKDRSQTEFFHTFNALHAAKRQIVVTSDKMPHEIPNLELRLKSRLQWGLIADIQPPEMETRVAILKRKADALGQSLPDDVAIYVATQVSTNIRELEGALTRLFAFAASKGRPLALDLVRESMRGLEQGAPLQLSVEAVQRAVCSFYDVKLADLKGTRRSKEIITPRQVAMYLARKLTGASYPEIGARFQKDHATVINAVTKIERLLLSDLQLKHAVDSLGQSLQQGR